MLKEIGGNAKDYVRIMWMILQAKKADDWVIAAGKTTSIREFVKLCEYVEIELEFTGSGVDEIGKIKNCSNEKFSLPIGKTVIEVNKKYFRPSEVDLLVGDSSKAKKELGWVPQIGLNELIEDMMESDLDLMSKKLLVETIEKIENKYIIGIFGVGYVGLSLAIAFQKKFNTLCYDINLNRINELKGGKDKNKLHSKKNYLILIGSKLLMG